MRKIGLCLGKYAPFHRGHAHVIETALREMDLVKVIIYQSRLTSIPLNKRAAWIRECFPHRVEPITAPDGPEETGYSPEIMKCQEEYVLKVLKGTPIHSFYSSEPYGEHMSRALKCRNRQVDPRRIHIPVSGTMIRENPPAFREFLPPPVYFDHIIKAVFHGAPGTGKTTLARALAEKYACPWMAEYGREYWEKHQRNRRLTGEQLLELALIHRKKEVEKAYIGGDYFFVDTGALSTYHFALDYHGSAVKELELLADDCRDRYDLHFLCGDDIPYDDTEDRSGEVHRSLFQRRFRRDLDRREIPYVLLEGSLNERMDRVARELNHYKENRTW